MEITKTLWRRSMADYGAPYEVFFFVANLLATNVISVLRTLAKSLIHNNCVTSVGTNLSHSNGNSSLMPWPAFLFFLNQLSYLSYSQKDVQ